MQTFSKYRLAEQLPSFCIQKHQSLSSYYIHRFWSVKLAVVPLVFLLFTLLCMGIAPAWAASNDQSTIPVFRLVGSLTETPADESFPLFSVPGTSLKDLVSRMRTAAEDPSVRAVVILPESFWPGLAQIEELQATISFIRSRNKEVYAHSDFMTMTDYLLVCGASHIGVTPTGLMFVPGLRSSSLHVRGLLDKLGIKPDFITEGAYKSAAEMFMRDTPSPEADAMMNWLMDSWHGSVVEMIRKGRVVEAPKVKEWIDGGFYTAEKAKSLGIIDAVQQTEDFEAMLKERFGKNIVCDYKYGRKKQPDLDFSSPFAMFKIWTDLLTGSQKRSGVKPAIGIVYVEGPIMTGRGMPNPFGGGVGAFSTDIREALHKAATDDSIKAVVLRIDSPGGSATASEIILDATKRLKKPLIVSMGTVAGSGGYYVACGAETIFADATTLTGSIGVVSGKLAMEEMWKKIGITFKEYKRGQNAGIMSMNDVFSPGERAQMQVFMDEIYTIFKKHVTDNRGKRLKKPIDEIAGGRVYTGKQALDLGLVDKVGTLTDAVAHAAKQANVDEYDVRVVPEPKNFLELLKEELSGNKPDTGRLQHSLSNSALIDLAKPYLQHMDRQAANAVISALRRLEILRQEGVVLSMPEIIQ